MLLYRLLVQVYLFRVFLDLSKHGDLLHEWVADSLLFHEYLRCHRPPIIVYDFVLAYVDDGALQHFLARRMLLLRVVENNVLSGGVLDGLNQVLLVVVDVDVAEEAEVVGGAEPFEVDAEDDDGETDEPEGHKEDVGCHTSKYCHQLQDLIGCEGVMAEEEATEEVAKLKKWVRECARTRE
jgi:hypothetical protein